MPTSASLRHGHAGLHVIQAREDLAAGRLRLFDRAGGDHRPLGPGQQHELPAGGVLVAVVRHLEHRGLRDQPRLDQLAFLGQLHVAGEQHVALRGGQAQHQRIVVFLLVILGEGAQHVKCAASLQRDAVSRRKPGERDGVFFRGLADGMILQALFGVERSGVDPVHGNFAFQQFFQPAHVVLVRVGDHNAVQTGPRRRLPARARAGRSCPWCRCPPESAGHPGKTAPRPPCPH